MVLLGAALPGAPAWAQGPAGGEDQQRSDQHARPGSEIVVTGVLPSSRLDALSGVAVLEGDELAQSVRPSIGETLAKTPGVSASSFGPSASRPILRGLEGERVRVLTDGIGAIDVSNTSADHATIVNPLLAERIEVLRGPQSLLYGSAAIGGVVNVLDRRIPVRIPDEPIHVAAIATYGSAADERSLAASADVPIAGRWVIHADASYARTDDLRIGGFALAAPLRAEAVAAGDPAIAANAAIRGTLPNTASKTTTGALGAAWLGAGGELGFAYTRYDSRYGIPIRFATAPGDEQEAPRIDVAQDRVDARVGLDLGGLLERAQFRFAFGDYRHFELEQDGSVGTAFFDQGMEGRLELRQSRRGAWSGALGGQFVRRDFDVVGDEAFLPKSSTSQLGLFTVQQLDLGRLKLEAGARFEHSAVESKPRPDQPDFQPAVSRRFDTVSASAGASYDLGGGWRLGANLSRTARAPAAEELFANGPHAGTEAFEIGDPSFAPERSWGVEAIVRRSGEDFSLEASAFHSWFDRFIYQDFTGAEIAGLPVFRFRQADARYYGFEVQAAATLARIGGARLTADGLVDYVHATIRGAGPAPRIPPLRLLGGIAAESRLIDARLEIERVTAQDRISAFETPTAGYTLANAELTVRPFGAERPLTVALSANNLFDVTARRHASVLKDFAPLAGRDLRVTARLEF